MTRKKITIAVIVVAVLGALAAANLLFTRETGVSVNVEAVQKRNLESIVSASGKLQPERSVNISADTMGRVTDLAVNEGDRVARGQFLLQIDPRNLRTAAQRAEAGLAAARSQLEQMRIGLESAKLSLQQAQDNVERQRQLWSQLLTTKEALDRAENELKLRQTDVQNQEKAIQTQVIRIEQETATAENARVDLSKVRIESPIAGIVTRRNIEEGETVVIGTMNNAGTVLLTVADMSVIEAEVDVDETDIPMVQLGQKAKITIDALPDRTFAGRVTEIGNSPIQASGQTGTQATNFKVVVTLDGEIPDVRPGFTCTAEITTATRESAVAVPIQALAVREVTYDEKGQIVRQQKEGRRRRPGLTTASAEELPKGHTRKEEEGVFLVRDTTAEFVPVRTGIAGDKYFEVLSGLKEGDKVIIGPFNSVRNLADSDTIKVAPATPARRP